MKRPMGVDLPPLAPTLVAAAKRAGTWLVDYGTNRDYVGTEFGDRIMVHAHAWLLLLGGHIMLHVRWSRHVVQGGADDQ